jgi:hypothetical protein
MRLIVAALCACCAPRSFGPGRASTTVPPSGRASIAACRRSWSPGAPGHHGYPRAFDLIRDSAASAVGGGSLAGRSHSRQFAVTQQLGRLRSEADIQRAYNLDYEYAPMWFSPRPKALCLNWVPPETPAAKVDRITPFSRDHWKLNTPTAGSIVGMFSVVRQTGTPHATSCSLTFSRIAPKSSLSRPSSSIRLMRSIIPAPSAVARY